MSDSELDRRRFIVAAIAFSGIASAFGHSRAWAQAGSDVGADTLGAMADMARRLFPHSAIEDSVYAAILDDALAATAADGSFAATLNAAENALNAQQGRRFADLAEPDQLAAMRAVQNEPFFAGIQAAVRTRLYNHPAVWEMLGYEGPSFGQGGYLNRGAGAIDWLPENP
jgi:hypothetical protein